MPLVNTLPAAVAAPWSSTIPGGTDSLITMWALEERDALSQEPIADFRWADRGTIVKPGVGIVKYAHAMAQTLQMRPFDGKRDLKQVGLVTKDVKPGAYELSFGFPMMWNQMGNGYSLYVRDDRDGTLLEVLGVSGVGLQGIPGKYVLAGRAKKAELVADLFFSSMYCTGSGITMTSPTKYTFAQPGNPNGIALFSDGTGADASGGAKHYANPAFQIAGTSVGRWQNVYSAYGKFDSGDNFGNSLAVMTQKPHPEIPNVQSGAVTTDVMGPPGMRTKFWKMMVQGLTMEWISSAGVKNGTSSVVGAAATTNAFANEAEARAALARAGITEENFIGAAFGPRRYWILPQLASHPYVLANTGKDMWINVCAAPGRATWAKGGANNAECVPVFRFFGPGDPKAEEDRACRFLGDLDIAFEPGAPGEIDVFFEV